MVSIKFLSNVGSITFRMLVISSFRFSRLLTAFKLNLSFKDSSLVLQSQVLTFRFSTEVMLSDRWYSILFIVISLSDANLFESSEVICSPVKLLSVAL